MIDRSFILQEKSAVLKKNSDSMSRMQKLIRLSKFRINGKIIQDLIKYV